MYDKELETRENNIWTKNKNFIEPQRIFLTLLGVSIHATTTTGHYCSPCTSYGADEKELNKRPWGLELWQPQEPKQCIYRCENNSRSFTSCVMASSHRAPKQWCLSKVETINSFENLKQNLLYTLSLESNFAPFLADGVQCLKKTKAQPLRGLEADGDPIPLARRLTARQKANFLELMLGQIANYCPIISRGTLVKNSTSFKYIL